MAYLHDAKLLIDQQRKDCCWRHKKDDLKRVILGVVCLLHRWVKAHVVDYSEGAGEENQLHGSVVPAAQSLKMMSRRRHA